MKTTVKQGRRERAAIGIAINNAEILDQKAAAITEMAENDDTNIIQLLNHLKLNLEDLTQLSQT